MIRRPPPKAVNFFRRHASYERRLGETVTAAKKRVAMGLARAEAEAAARGWRCEWEGDPDGDALYGAVMRDMDGHVIASVWEIDRPSREDRRVVEAELALEALGEKR